MTARSPYTDTTLATRVDLAAIAAWNYGNQRAVTRNRRRAQSEPSPQPKRTPPPPRSYPFSCPDCVGAFETKRGLINHQSRWCPNNRRKP